MAKPSRPKNNSGEPERNAPPKAEDQTRDALEFCFDDVSSMTLLGAAPLNDLISAGASTPPAGDASSAAGGRREGQRWNLVVLALLVVTLAAATAATLLGR